MKRIGFFLAIVLLLLTTPISALAGNEGPVDEFDAEFAQGDVNGDGKVNSIDYAMVKRYVLRTLNLNETQIAAADVNGDGNVSDADAMYLLRYTLFGETRYPLH